ncbi:MAG: hypothetical protein OQL19_22770 [Gammaproteobacteria bacterium]|nr:hypothetical protein [Gammaproteobacteria bacterium]
MLSQNTKSIKITIASLVITGSTLGGAVSAQSAINAQNIVSADQTVIITEETNSKPVATTITTDNTETQENTFNNKKYNFPPANAVPQYPQNQPVNTQAGRQSQNYPMPYPSQRQMNPNARPYYGAQQRPMPMNSGPGVPTPYGMPGNYNPSLHQTPYNQGPYGQNPYNRGPYGNPYNANPYNRGPYGSPYPYGRGSSNNGPFDRFGMGPFNGDSAPWETWPFGARDSFWSRKEMPFKDQNPSDWFQPGDPKEGAAIMWDDLISAPDDLGTMPGGWHVPSVSVPNPVDLEDQFEKASKEIPDIIRVYSD